MYEELASKFVDDGFSVLRYDFYGHGCSKFKYGGDISFFQISAPTRTVFLLVTMKFK